MKILKFWYVACTIFCIYNLNMLVEERYEVEYLAVNKSETELEILACYKLSSFNFKNKSIELSQLSAHLSNQFHQGLRKSQRPNYEQELILNAVKTGNYLIFNELLCIIAEENEGKTFLGSPYNIVFFTLKKSTIDFVRMTSKYEEFDQLS